MPFSHDDIANLVDDLVEELPVLDGLDRIVDGAVNHLVEIFDLSPRDARKAILRAAANDARRQAEEDGETSATALVKLGAIHAALMQHLADAAQAVPETAEEPAEQA